MLDLQEHQVIAQLLDNMDNAISKLEKSYNSNDGESFTKAQDEVLDIYNKLSKMIK